jgi:DnaJ-class molecular chaperone
MDSETPLVMASPEKAFVEALECECERCGGTGRGVDDECPFCEGAGYIPTEAGRKVLDLVRHQLSGRSPR